MTPLEYTLLPVALSIVLLILGAAFYRSHQIAQTIALLGPVISYVCCQTHFERFAIISVLVILGFSSNRKNTGEEFKIFILLSLMGALTCIAARDFLTLFVGIELLTMPIYGLIAWETYRSTNIQAAIKYLVLAGAASAFMLLGMAFLYADSGSMALQLRDLRGSLLLFVGIGFKLSLAPFHLWTGDVYEDSPLPATALLATISKIALIGVLVHLTPIQRLFPILSALAIISMLTGSLLTLRQKNMSRFLGYSSIAHMGYILVAWLIGADLSLYTAAYTMSVLVAFWALSFECPESNWVKGSLSLAFLSLMGLPVLPIFWGKYQILILAFQGQYFGLFGVLIFSSLLGVYGYARLIARIYQGSV